MNKNALLLLALIEGGSVMALELLGARLVTPLFGSSLVMWTILLAVTLLGLALGYFIGGWASTKNTSTKNLLFTFFSIAAVSTIFTRSIAAPTLLFASDFGLYTGCFIASSIILIIPLTALGSTSALIIKELAKSNSQSGKSAGSIYAISTLGGVLTTFLTGFYIIPNFGITVPIIVLSWLLLLTAVAAFYHKKKIPVYITLLFIFILVNSSIVGPDKNPKQIQYKLDLLEEGLLGQLRVDHLNMPVGNQILPVKRLMVNNIGQSIMRSYSDNTSHWAYIHLMSIIASTSQERSSALLCGFGAGVMAKELLKQQFIVDAIEIDSRLETIAQEHFDYSGNCNFIVDDARHFIKTTKKKYDLIVLDLLRVESQPSNLYTIESFLELKQILNPNGLIVINFQGNSTGEETKPYYAIYGTLKAAGFHVEDWRTPNGQGDIIFLVTNPNTKLTFKQNKINDCCKTFHPQFNQGIIGSRDFQNFDLLTDDNLKL